MLTPLFRLWKAGVCRILRLPCETKRGHVNIAGRCMPLCRHAMQPKPRHCGLYLRLHTMMGASVVARLRLRLLVVQGPLIQACRTTLQMPKSWSPILRSSCPAVDGRYWTYDVNKDKYQFQVLRPVLGWELSAAERHQPSRQQLIKKVRGWTTVLQPWNHGQSPESS